MQNESTAHEQQSIRKEDHGVWQEVNQPRPCQSFGLEPSLAELRCKKSGHGW
ncbi:MAG: hypothetical protein Q7U53_14210 [Anaerolineaceae bacterium]|nr:hypothetical protein [Anaerolineaceae bacterium]